MNLVSFFPKYPNISKNKDPLLNPYIDIFSNTIVNKKEFKELKLPKFEPVPNPGEQFQHQKLLSRFLSSVTPYNEILFFMEMGTGKTCSAIGVIEQIRYEKQKSLTGALIFTRGDSLLRNFKNELLFKCTDGRYIPENYNNLTELQKVHQITKITRKFYDFSTFEKFAKQLKKLSDGVISNMFSNKIIVIDEVHNIRLKEDKDTEDLDIYDQFHK